MQSLTCLFTASVSAYLCFLIPEAFSDEGREEDERTKEEALVNSGSELGRQAQTKLHVISDGETTKVNVTRNCKSMELHFKFNLSM